jgi:hypothetical protein
VASDVEKFRLVTDVIKTALWSIAAVFIAYLFFDAVKHVVGTYRQLSALAKVVENFTFGDVVSVTGNLVIWPCCWGVMYRSRTRAIKEKAYFQKIVESNDPGRLSSDSDESD